MVLITVSLALLVIPVGVVVVVSVKPVIVSMTSVDEQFAVIFSESTDSELKYLHADIKSYASPYTIMAHTVLNIRCHMSNNVY